MLLATRQHHFKAWFCHPASPHGTHIPCSTQQTTEHSLSGQLLARFPAVVATGRADNGQPGSCHISQEPLKPKLWMQGTHFSTLKAAVSFTLSTTSGTILSLARMTAVSPAAIQCQTQAAAGRLAPAPWPCPANHSACHGCGVPCWYAFYQLRRVNTMGNTCCTTRSMPDARKMWEGCTAEEQHACSLTNEVRIVAYWQKAHRFVTLRSSP